MLLLSRTLQVHQADPHRSEQRIADPHTRLLSSSYILSIPLVLQTSSLKLVSIPTLSGPLPMALMLHSIA